MADKRSVKVRAMALPEALGRDTKLGLTGWKLRLRPNKNRIRLVLGAVEAFGGFLSLGGAMIPGAVSGCFCAVLWFAQNPPGLIGLMPLSWASVRKRFKPS